MKQEFLRHRFAYSILLIGIFIFVVLFLGAWPNRWIQRMIIVSMSIFYFFWGVLTHFKTKTITRDVIYEYGGVSLLAGLIMFLITV